jgi:hypothetical protein
MAAETDCTGLRVTGTYRRRRAVSVRRGFFYHCARQRLWFIDQLHRSSAEYNRLQALHLGGKLAVTRWRARRGDRRRHESLPPTSKRSTRSRCKASCRSCASGLRWRIRATPFNPRSFSPRNDWGQPALSCLLPSLTVRVSPLLSKINR